MDVFCSGLPEHISQNELVRLFAGPLKDCGIEVFHVEKFYNKGLAVITILDAHAGQVFLHLYGLPRYSPRTQLALRRISYAGKFVRLEESSKAPSDLSLQSLRYDATQRAKALIGGAAADKHHIDRQSTKFRVSTLQCGTWDYANNAKLRRDADLLFLAQYTDPRQGSIHFGKREAIVILGPDGGDQLRVDLPYADCIDIVLGTYEEPSATFALRFPPKMYELNTLATSLSALSLGPAAARLQQAKKVRVPAIDPSHEKIVGGCFVYRVCIHDSRSLATIKRMLSRGPKLCSVISENTRTEFPQATFDAGMAALTRQLSDAECFGTKPFKLRFQVDRLARNGYLSPQKVLSLLPTISETYASFGLDATITGIRRLARSIPYPGPTVERSELTQRALEGVLHELVTYYHECSPGNPFELAKRHVHINLIHKVVVTPFGIRLEGPEPEPTNRVLRKYSDNTDDFVRVVFQDEDGGPLRYDPRADNSRIYHGRFKRVLDTDILICGRAFSFLGFSHSSLRSQSCWFMAPFVNKSGRLMLAEKVLQGLGDFTKIRTPAKCAARIGQNFTDTNATVLLDRQEVFDLQVVERNNRDFSDGVGTISQELLREVWRTYGTKKLLKPTVLQIRFQGAKGMVSLDARLPGRALMLRSNMRKYDTETSWMLEICGAAFKPLPVVLNQQFIKIFEDLGISMTVFLDLQRLAMKHLRQMTGNSINTAKLLEDSPETTRAAGVPALIKYLGQIGLDYHQDPFLYSVVEMAVVSKLRDIKYRARIPVANGVTLYGIMDETGYLKENQIFVILQRAPEGGKQVLVKTSVVITRSPAMHPGDIQVVDAVNVPAESLLRRLSNVVVFSKWGERDLPSKLSGGDLDGDMYNVIWHEGMVPRTTYPAADYQRAPPVVLDRDVLIKDMSDFFVTFMETDLLGMICTIHKQLADQRDAGTLDPDCLTLAGLASTAVDYSKTGVAVNHKQIPRTDRLRPDFMAPSPRVIVSGGGLLDLEEEEQTDDDAFEGLDSERRPFRHYESKKTLGHLYRDIDENQFLRNMQQEHRAVAVRLGKNELMSQLAAYVKKIAEQYGVLWAHCRGLASRIRRNYEDGLANILYEFEPTPHQPLTESEVFAGHILGRQSGPKGKPLRELAKTMRERFEVIVEHTVARIVHGEEAISQVEDMDDLDDARYDGQLEALPRAIACLDVAVSGEGYRDRHLGQLKSFQYVAAAVCVRQLDRFRVTTLAGSSGLPKAF